MTGKYCIFPLFELRTKYEGIDPRYAPISLLKHFQAINPSFITISKPICNKIGKAFCEELRGILRGILRNILR